MFLVLIFILIPSDALLLLIINADHIFYYILNALSCGCI